MGKSQRTKGHNFERRVAADLRAIFPGAKRGFQTRGGTAEAPDVDGTPFFVECKAHKKVDRASAYAQAVKGTLAQGNSRIPIAVCKDDRQPPVVRIALEDLVDVWGGAELLRDATCADGLGIHVELTWEAFLGLLEARYGKAISND